MNCTALVGNHRIKAQLEQQLQAGGLGHAYLISGPSGSGRKTLAGVLCAAMLCAAPPAQRPCNTCAQCKKVAGGIHPDVSHLGDGEKPISVDQVRALRTDAHIRPNEGGRKVYVLHQAGEMNPSAQNALLKLLEEGPDYAAFLLLTHHPDALLETVRSRCQHLALSPVGEEEAVAWLQGRFPEKSQQEIAQAALAAQGILGQGVRRLEEQAQDQAMVSALAQAMESGTEWGLFQAAMPLEKLGRDELTPTLNALEQALVGALARTPNPRLLRGVALVKQLRGAAALNANPGQLAGWLCAGMF